MIDLSGLSGALRWFGLTRDGEWLQFEHRRSGDRYRLRALDVVDIARNDPEIELVDVIRGFLPDLCEQCGLELETHETTLCAVCTDVEFERMVQLGI